MEKLLLKQMNLIVLGFGIIVFLSWFIPLFNYPVWNWIQSITWIQEIKWISTQYMFTTLWAIFAFWYWYKKYERDKEIQIIDKLLQWNFSLDNFSLVPWNTAYKMSLSWYLKDDYYKLVNDMNMISLRKFLLKIWKSNSHDYEDSEKLIQIAVQFVSVDKDFQKQLKPTFEKTYKNTESPLLKIVLDEINKS